jgi:hypothetical protein
MKRREEKRNLMLKLLSLNNEEKRKWMLVEEK